MVLSLSAPGAVDLLRVVHLDEDVRGVEVHLATLAKDVASADPRGTRSCTLSVGHDEQAIPAATVLRIVGELSGSIEVGSATTNPLGRNVCALAPGVDILVESDRVEGNNVDGDVLGEATEFTEEFCQHVVADRSRLIDGDKDLGYVAFLDAWVDVRVALVDSLDRGAAAALDEVADELAKDVPPIDHGGDRLADGFNHVGRHVSPAIGLGVGVLGCLLDHCPDLAFNVFTLLLRNAVPGVMVVHRDNDVAFPGEFFGSHALLLGFLLDLFEVPFGRLHGWKLGDDLRQLHALLLVCREVSAFGVLWEDTGNECEFGEDAITRDVGGILLIFLVEEDGVNGKIGGDVPKLGWCLAACLDVAEHEVIVFVIDDTTDLAWREGTEEFRVPVHHDFVVLLIEGDRGCGDRSSRSLLDMSAELCEERRILQERNEMPVKVEIRLSLSEHKLPLSLKVRTLHRWSKQFLSHKILFKFSRISSLSQLSW